jgi:hypothetical protein
MADGFKGLLGNMVFPQLVNQNVTNKQLIDAAILRGSLELLKPRQPGENLASQASRALQAGSQFGKDVFEQQQASLVSQLKQQKLQKELSDGTQLSLTKPEIAGIAQIVRTKSLSNENVKEKREKFAKKIGDTFELPFTDINAETDMAIATEVGALQNVFKDKTPAELVDKALDNLLGNKSVLNSKSNNDPEKPDLTKVGKPK